MITDESVKAIENLHRMKAEGIITEEDFEKSKQRILFGAATSIAGSSAVSATPPVDDIVGWLRRPWQRWSDYQGRSGRREFWVFQLIPAAMGIIFVLVAEFGGRGYGEPNAFQSLVVLLTVGVLLALIVPQLALQVRRFHDQDRSGWFVLVNAIPYFGPLIVLAMMLIPGTSEDNRFGSPPEA